MACERRYLFVIARERAPTKRYLYHTLYAFDVAQLLSGESRKLVIEHVATALLPITETEDEWHIIGFPHLSVTRKVNPKEDTDESLIINVCARQETQSRRQRQFLSSIVFTPPTATDPAKLYWEKGAPPPDSSVTDIRENLICGTVSKNGRCLFGVSKRGVHPEVRGVVRYPEFMMLYLDQDGSTKVACLPEEIASYLDGPSDVGEWTVFLDPERNALLCVYRRDGKEEYVDIYYPYFTY